MKKLKFKLNFLYSSLLLSLILTSCKATENEDGSDSTTYSSCKITSSSALFASDRENDLKQCWDGVDYESQGDALQWCQSKVNTYMSNRYVFGHTIQYAVESTNCPN